MRLNINNYKAILREKRLTDEYVRKAVGLSEMTYSWLLKRGSIECETLEQIADAIGCHTQDILLPDCDGDVENNIEWLKDEKRATLSLSQRRTISRVKQLAKQYPEQCQIMAENKDGSICAHIPTNWVKISPPKEVSDAQREASRRNIQTLHQKHVTSTDNQE